MLLKIITIFLFIKNQTIFHSFLLQQVFLLILKKSPFSYLQSKISNIRKHLPNKKRNLLDLPSSFQYSIHPQFTKFLSQEYPHLFTIKHWPKNPIITIHIPPLECIFQTKKKKKMSKHLPPPPPPPSSSTSKKQRNSANVIKQSPDIQSTYPSNRYFHLSRKMLDNQASSPSVKRSQLY